jgi:hypothetical protein
VITARYTGRDVSTLGTSISIGYVGDSYIDFGLYGAIGIPLILGLMYGWMTRQLLILNRTADVAMYLAVVTILFLPLQQFEISSIKLFPGILLQLIVCGAWLRLAWPIARPYFANRRVSNTGRASVSSFMTRD